MSFLLFQGTKVVIFLDFSNLMQTFAEKIDFFQFFFGRVNHFVLICKEIDSFIKIIVIICC